MKSFTLARPYAKAAYLFAKEGNTIAFWAESLGEIAKLIEDPKLADLLSHPKFDPADFVEIVASKLKDKNAPYIKNFLLLLNENHRLNLLPDIYELFLADMQAEAETLQISVKSAMKLSKTELKDLQADLEKKFKQNIEMSVSEDSSLIGGLIIESGDYVIDGSLRGQLQRLKTNLTL